MLAIAVLVPDTALLVPGAAGRTTLLTEVRGAALAAVGELVLAAPDRVVVVAPGRADREIDRPVRPSLAAAGIADADLDWAVPDPAFDAAPDPVPDPGAPGVPPPAVGTSVALLLLARAGWTGSVRVVEVAPPVGGGADRAAALRALGAGLAAGPGRTAVLVAGSLSARNGPGAPHPQDDRAGPFDAAMVADLALGDAPARGRLAAVPAELAAELAVTAWAPLQVLLGAAGDVASFGADVRYASAPFGVTYAVATWRTR